MKKFSADATYSVPAARVREIQTDEAFVDFLAQRFAGDVGAEVRSRSVTTDGETATTVATVFVSPDNLPGMARRFLSDGVEVTIRQVWDAPAADGSHTGEFAVSSKPDKATLRTRFVLRDDGEGSSRHYDGQLSVNIPLVGGAVEKEALKHTDRVMRIEAEVLEAYLREQGA